MAFCHQVDHYEAGYGVAGQDYIHVTCIVGPAGATVSNAMNGTYSCGGTYKLTTFSTARISLNWGGSTSYSLMQDFQIPARGQGSFTVKVTKTSGGSGNLFFSMSSGSSWMFDTVLINTGCTSIVGAPRAGAPTPAVALNQTPLPPDANSTIVERVYNADGSRVTGRVR